MNGYSWRMSMLTFHIFFCYACNFSNTISERMRTIVYWDCYSNSHPFAVDIGYRIYLNTNIFVVFVAVVVDVDTLTVTVAMVNRRHHSDHQIVGSYWWYIVGSARYFPTFCYMVKHYWLISYCLIFFCLLESCCLW